MNSVTTNTVDVLGEGAISPTAVEGAVYKYREHFQYYPDELAMHPRVRYDLLNQILPGETIRCSDYGGMKMVVDPDFGESQWLVRRSESITRALP